MNDSFTSMLKKPIGNNYVLKNDKTHDYQQLQSDYLNYVRTLARDNVKMEDLLTSLTKIHLSLKYRGEIIFFIHYLDMMMSNEELTPLVNHFPNMLKYNISELVLNM